MPLPTNNSETERLQDAIKLLFNRKANRHFKDVTGTEVTDPTSNRALLRWSCIHKENDSIQQTIARQLLFLFECQSFGDNLAKVYGMPLDDFVPVTNVPQITFHFLEKRAATIKRKSNRPKPFRISMRITEETSSTITQSNIDTWESRIRTQFPNSFVYKTGVSKWSYVDQSKGNRFILSAYDLGEAKDVITRVLAVRNLIPDWELLKESKHVAKNYRTPEYETILGKRVKKPERRIITESFLKKVELNIGGGLKIITLYERFA